MNSSPRSTRHTGRHRPGIRGRAWAILVVVALAVAAGVGFAVTLGTPDSPSGVVSLSSDRTERDALEVLDGLAVKGRAPKSGYDRVVQFGEAWFDADKNGCDTRNDILLRDLEHAITNGCRVLAGTLTDPYTGKHIDFVRGEATSPAVQIDHIVALSNAWQTGAQQLSYEERVALANDPLNLIAVDGPTNKDKGDGDAATWLPPQREFRCEYVARQVSVKALYGLWVTPAERDAMRDVLRECPPQLVSAPA